MFDPRKMMDLLKNAGEMQKNFGEKLKNQKASGEAGGGMVKVELNGLFEVESLTLDAQILQEDKAFVEDVIKSAINDAGAKLRSNLSESLKSMFGGLGL